MGPRLISRGNMAALATPEQLHCRFNGAATDQSRKLKAGASAGATATGSMGPRLISRGNRSGPHLLVAAPSLQWGRD